jgi:hypothetical protein
MTSQEHRDRANIILSVGIPNQLGATLANAHATLAVYEGLFELFGDESLYQEVARELWIK